MSAAAKSQTSVSKQDNFHNFLKNAELGQKDKLVSHLEETFEKMLQDHVHNPKSVFEDYSSSVRKQAPKSSVQQNKAKNTVQALLEDDEPSEEQEDLGLVVDKPDQTKEYTKALSSFFVDYLDQRVSLRLKQMLKEVNQNLPMLLLLVLFLILLPTTCFSVK
jgi:hypothetical protein